MSSEIVPLPDDPRAETAVNQGVRTYGELHPLPTNEKKKRPLSEAARVSRMGRGYFIPSDSGADRNYERNSLGYPSEEARAEQIRINASGAARARAALRAIRRGEDFDIPDPTATLASDD